MSSNSSSSSSDDDNDENRLGTDDAQILASQKALIYKHPLFPVLVYVLERCEQATLNPSLLLTTNNDETYIPASFEHNLKVFLTKNNDILACHHRERDDLSSTIDDFYVDAMQVLRIHLLELDKVNDLCRDFCQRYIACLKVKLNTHNIFTDDEEDDDDEEEEELDEDDEEGESNDFDMVDDDEDFASSDEEDSMFNHQPPPPTSKENFREQQQHFGKQLVLNNSTSLVHSCATQFDGQTPLSQIISSGRSHFVDSSSSTLLFDGFSIKRRKQLSSTAPILVSSSSSSSKRGVLPKSATSIMRSWLFQHIVHPYPTEDEKRAISQKTNLSLLQVNNWFINARRRILQPMLEASNPDLVANKKKKRHETSLNTLRTTTTTTSDDNPHRQTTHISRYWPSNLAQLDVGHRKK